MRVGDCIKILRDSAGLKQRELAELIGVSASLLSLVEANKRDPSIKLLRDVARAMKIPSAVLFAVALAGDEANHDRAALKDVHGVMERLLAATQHSLLARRVTRLRVKRSA